MQILKNLSFYILPSIVSGIVPIFMLPITTRYLTAEDFGILGIFTLCSAPLSILSEWGTAYVLLGEWHRRSDEEKKSLSFSLLCIEFSLRLFAILTVCLVGFGFFSFLAGDSWEKISGIMPWLFVQHLVNFPSPIFNQWITLKRKAKENFYVELARTLIYIPTNLAIVIMTKNINYVIIGQILMNDVLFAPVLVFLMRKDIRLAFNRSYIKEVLVVGFPIFVRSAFNQSRKRIDKLFVSSQFTSSEFGIYNWAFKMHGVYNRLEQSYDRVITPDLFGYLQSPSDRINRIRQNYRIWFFLVYLGILIFAFWGRDFLRLLTNDVLTSSYSILLLLGCETILRIPFLGTANILTFFKRTDAILYSTLGSALASLLVCYFAIPHFGLKGGALGVVAGTFFGQLIMNPYKRKYMREPLSERLFWLAIPLVGFLIFKAFG